MFNRRVVRRVMIVAFALLCCGFGVSWIVGGLLVASRPSVVGDPPSDLPATAIELESGSGQTIIGWHLPSERMEGVVVLLHGIGGSRASMIERARVLYGEGYSIVMIDLQGHGESGGQQITLGHLERHDARAAVEFARLHHPGEPIGVIGVSLGGASALFASPLQIDALVLESVYPNIRDAVSNRVEAKLGPVAMIPTALLLVQLRPRLGISADDLRPIDRVPHVHCPLLVVSGCEDLHTTALESQRLFDAAVQPKELWMVEGAAHVDLHRTCPEEYERRVLDFMRRHLRSSSD